MNRLRLSTLNTSKCLTHSAKGSTWEDHKYIRRVDGTYYYPDSYQGGRHISDLNQSDKVEATKSETDTKLSETDVDNLAREVIRGNFGNGLVRKELLGDNYREVQDRVNELLRGSVGSANMSEVTISEADSKMVDEAVKEVDEKIEEIVKKVDEKSPTQASNGLNLEAVYNVYRNKK